MTPIYTVWAHDTKWLDHTLKVLASKIAGPEGNGRIVYQNLLASDNYTLDHLLEKHGIYIETTGITPEQFEDIT